jgi:nucleotide-binding universal stress UspA family protein
MFRKILVPLDHSLFAEQALGQASAIARASRGELDLTLVHEPLPMGGLGDAPWHAEQWESEQRYLLSTAEELSDWTGVPVTTALVQGPLVESICKRAWEVEADLIAMTTHGRTGFSRVWLGSVADGVVRHSRIPVLLLRPFKGTFERFAPRCLVKHILVPLDGSEFAEDALLSAAALADSARASITLLRVVLPVPIASMDAGLPFVHPNTTSAHDDLATWRAVDHARRSIEQTVRRLNEEGVDSVVAEVVVAHSAALGIVEFAQRHDVDVIAMSTHGRGVSRLFLGSVADKVIRGSEIPILVHRPMSVSAKVSLAESKRVSAPLPALVER